MTMLDFKLDTIYNEDCLETMRRMPDNFIDLTVTSPPYDDVRTFGGAYVFNFEATAKELYRVTKEGGVIMWQVGDKVHDHNESGSSFRQALGFKDAGFKLFDTMIYQRPPTGAKGNNLTYWNCFDYMFILSKGKPKTVNLIRDRRQHNTQEKPGTKRLQSGEQIKTKAFDYPTFGRRTNIWLYNVGSCHSTNDEEAYDHPAVFPEKLAADHIVSWSNDHDIVYDPFAGSGTTLKMACLLRRHYIGSEINSKYIEIIKKRLSKVESLTRITDY